MEAMNCLCRGWSPQIIPQERGILKSRKVRDLLHSLGETASAWLQMLFASMIGKAVVVMADEAALGGRKAN